MNFQKVHYISLLFFALLINLTLLNFSFLKSPKKEYTRAEFLK